MAVLKTVAWPITVALPGFDANGAPVQLTLALGSNGQVTVTNVQAGSKPIPPA